jgi:CRISPR/Cas system CSM-associated protein Csm4 (group 5 of RAMP superfamily)
MKSLVVLYRVVTCLGNKKCPAVFSCSHFQNGSCSQNKKYIFISDTIFAAVFSNIISWLESTKQKVLVLGCFGNMVTNGNYLIHSLFPNMLTEKCPKNVHHLVVPNLEIKKQPGKVLVFLMLTSFALKNWNLKHYGHN